MKEVGEHWAYREWPRATGAEVLHVEIIQRGPKGSNKLRIRWIDGE